MQYEVKDGARTLQFSGTMLGTSSSKRRDSTRWIQFALYKTDNGSYILSRVGVSLIFHTPSCPLVDKYGLQDMSIELVRPDAIPCEECRPTLAAPLVYPEKFRYWVFRSEDPTAILNALYKTDENESRYLTRVAERLLEEASGRDPELDSVYRIEIIP